jgi:hypothetical protein
VVNEEASPHGEEVEDEAEGDHLVVVDSDDLVDEALVDEERVTRRSLQSQVGFLTLHCNFS